MPKATEVDTRRKSYKVFTKQHVDQDVHTAALDRMRHIYEVFDHVAVAFSGGKDSTCVLHIALEVANEIGRLPLRVIFWDEEAIPYETEEYVRRVAARDDVALEWLALPVKHRNACSNASPFWYPWASEARDLWCRDLPPEAITTLDGFPNEPPTARWTIPEMNGLITSPERGRAALVMGIRAAESITRHQAVARRTNENYMIRLTRNDTPTLRSPISKVYPCYDWHTTDVWAAPARFGWDHNAAYDVMEMEGIAHSAQRCAPPFGEEPMQKLWVFKTCFPDLWDRMSERVPGASTAARYASTELYSFGEVPPKPADQTWEQHVHHLVSLYDDEARAQAVHEVQRWIRQHYTKTSEPILPFSPHPETGISWEGLALIASRGNFKGRHQMNPGRNEEKQLRMRTEYDAERATIEAELGRPIAHDTGSMT